jgi:hypothetical protein
MLCCVSGAESAPILWLASFARISVELRLKLIGFEINWAPIALYK